MWPTSTKLSHQPLLTPLDRRTSYFSLSGPDDPRTADVPAEDLDGARIGVTPEVTTGYATIHFDLPDITLSDYCRPPKQGR